MIRDREFSPPLALPACPVCKVGVKTIRDHHTYPLHLQEESLKLKQQELELRKQYLVEVQRIEHHLCDIKITLKSRR